MGGRLKSEITQKTNEMRSKLKDLASTYASIFEISKRNHNNKLMFLKRNLDKVNTAKRRIMDISLEEDNKEDDVKASDKAIANLCSTTLANIAKIEKMMDEKVSKESRENNHYSKKMGNLRKNLDNLRVAHDTIRRIDPSMNLSDREWKSIEKDL